MRAQALQFRLEAWAARLALRLLRLLSPVAASNLGGALARGIGPLLPVSRIADANLRLAMPELDGAARRRIVRGAWDNLGRTVAELPHVAALCQTASGPGWEIEGAEIVRALVATGGPVVLVTGHFGNWEMLPSVGAAFGMRMANFYRAASNPLVDRIILDLRNEAAGVEVPQFPKGASGARAAFAFLRDGGTLGVLIDQKMNDGIAVPFFGRKAMTAPAAASYALHFQAAVFPVRAVRLGPARFRVVCDPPLKLPASGDRHADIAALTGAINDRLQQWIIAYPEQWLWLHRRWDKEDYG